MRKKNILVIDDDEMNLQIARMILQRKLPCEVVAVDNGVEGLDVLRSQRINLVLLDVLMPDFDGIETLAEIRADEKISAVPVMMLTASGDMDNVRRAAELGVKDYIKKPFMPADLIERVKLKLEEQHAEEILLIGDDAEELQKMRTLIEENFSHEVSIADANSAVEILRKIEPTLIIADANMKFVNGFRILDFLTTDEKFSNIPFALTDAEKILELVDKINAPPPVEKPPVEKPPAPKIEKPVVESDADKKKIAGVVTTLIGYKLRS